MRVIVTGSRAWPDPVKVAHELNTLYLQHGPFVLVHGACATGADAAAARWYEVCGLDLGCTEVKYPAEWTKHGKGARSIRDREMVKTGADLTIAFPLFDDGDTKNTIDLAEAAGIQVRKVMA